MFHRRWQGSAGPALFEAWRPSGGGLATFNGPDVALGGRGGAVPPLTSGGAAEHTM